MLDSPYRGRLISVGTRHGKQYQLAAGFRRVLGARLITPPNLDTDRFGTFTGDAPRNMSPLEAARAKARLAMDASGLPFGLASEASYGVLTADGWFGHEEILLFCDALLDIEVLEGFRTASVPGASHCVADFDEVSDALVKNLSTQALIVRALGIADPAVALVKGITDTSALRTAITAAAARSPEGRAVVEPDLRAHHNPSRRRILTELADTLARRLATRCADCETPGFGRVSIETGLPCRICRSPTALVHTDIHGCAACKYRQRQPVPVASADPAHCPQCNP